MIYLYRFDMLQMDGVISSSNAEYLDPAALLPGMRTTYRHTNYNQSVLSIDAGSSAFLPAYGDTSVNWTTEAIDHEQIRLNGEKLAGQVKVSLPISHPLSQLYVADTPATQTWLTIMSWDIFGEGNSIHPGNIDPLLIVGPTMPVVIFVGQVINAEYDEFRCKFTFDHLQNILLRPGLTVQHPRVCGHLLYDSATCGMKADAIGPDGYWMYREDGFSGNISDDGMFITVPEAVNKPDGWFSHGYLTVSGQYTFQSGDSDHIPRVDLASRVPSAGMGVYAGFRRAIASHQGNTISLVTPLFPGDVAPGAKVTLYAGCDGALATCKSKFSNVARHGGYPYIPIKNPFDVGLRSASGLV